MDHLIYLKQEGKYTFDTPKNRAKSFANKNFSEIIEDNYSMMNTKASTGAKFQQAITNFVKIKTNSAEYYEGETDKSFNRSGYGIYHYANGDIYEGEFKDGLREGIGEYSYIDGCVYRGEWAEDKKEGKGVIKIDNVEYAGKWQEDCIVSGLKYEINKFKKNNLDDDIDCDLDDCNSVNLKEMQDDAYRNADDTSVSKFELKSCELEGVCTDDVGTLIQDMYREWKMLTHSDHAVVVSMDMIDKKKRKLNTKDSTDSTNSHLSESNDIEANQTQSRLNSCYFDYFSKLSRVKSEDDKNILANNYKNGDNLGIKETKAGCHCEKFISEMIIT